MSSRERELSRQEERKNTKRSCCIENREAAVFNRMKRKLCDLEVCLPLYLPCFHWLPFLC